MKLSIKLVEINNHYVATCPELDINCYGSSKSEAERRIRSVLTFYINSAKELGLDVENIDSIIIDGKEKYVGMNDYQSESSKLLN